MFHPCLRLGASPFVERDYKDPVSASSLKHMNTTTSAASLRPHRRRCTHRTSESRCLCTFAFREILHGIAGKSDSRGASLRDCSPRTLSFHRHSVTSVSVNGALYTFVRVGLRRRLVRATALRTPSCIEFDDYFEQGQSNSSMATPLVGDDTTGSWRTGPTPGYTLIPLWLILLLFVFVFKSVLNWNTCSMLIPYFTHDNHGIIYEYVFKSWN